MKRRHTLLPICLLAAVPSIARTGLSISFQGGPQRTDMRCDKLVTENRTGYAMGVGAAYGIGRHLTIGVDAMYSSEGRRMDFRSLFQGGEADLRERTGYLKMPAYLGYTFRPDRTISFSVRLGPQFSYLLNAELYDKVEEKVVSKDTRAAYNKVNLGGMAGFDVNARLSRTLSLSLGLRADMTLTDTEVHSLYFPALSDSYTRNVNAGAWLGVHYRFSRAVAAAIPQSGS